MLCSPALVSGKVGVGGRDDTGAPPPARSHNAVREWPQSQRGGGAPPAATQSLNWSHWVPPPPGRLRRGTAPQAGPARACTVPRGQGRAGGGPRHTPTHGGLPDGGRRGAPMPAQHGNGQGCPSAAAPGMGRGPAVALVAPDEGLGKLRHAPSLRGDGAGRTPRPGAHHLRRLQLPARRGGDYRGRDGRPCQGEIESGADAMIAFIASPTGGPRTAGEQRAAEGTQRRTGLPATAEPPVSQPGRGGCRGR